MECIDPNGWLRALLYMVIFANLATFFWGQTVCRQMLKQMRDVDKFRLHLKAMENDYLGMIEERAVEVAMAAAGRDIGEPFDD